MRILKYEDVLRFNQDVKLLMTPTFSLTWKGEVQGRLNCVLVRDGCNLECQREIPEMLQSKFEIAQSVVTLMLKVVADSLPRKLNSAWNWYKNYWIIYENLFNVYCRYHFVRSWRIQKYPNFEKSPRRWEQRLLLVVIFNFLGKFPDFEPRQERFSIEMSWPSFFRPFLPQSIQDSRNSHISAGCLQVTENRNLGLS